MAFNLTSHLFINYIYFASWIKSFNCSWQHTALWMTISLLLVVYLQDMIESANGFYKFYYGFIFSIILNAIQDMISVTQKNKIMVNVTVHSEQVQAQTTTQWIPSSSNPHANKTTQTNELVMYFIWQFFFSARLANLIIKTIVFVC